MEYRLYGIEIRGIGREIAQFSSGGLDRLVHAGDLVKRDVVDDHDVLALQRGNQTLLEVSQKGWPVHGPLDEHRRDDTSLAETGDQRHRLPMPHWDVSDQALAAWAPTVEADHIGGDRGFIDKHQVRGVEQSLLALPASARPNYVLALSLGCPQAFFYG